MLQEGVLVDAAAVDLDVRRGPELAHPGIAPHLDALGPGLQDRHQDDAPAPVVGVQVGKCAPPAHVGRLVEDPEQRGPQPTAGGAGSQLLRCLDDGDGERRHERAGRAPALLGQRVERATVGAHEVLRAELLARVRGALGRHPARHLAIRQARGHLHGRAEDAPALLLRGGDDAGNLISGSNARNRGQSLSFPHFLPLPVRGLRPRLREKQRVHDEVVSS